MNCMTAHEIKYVKSTKRMSGQREIVRSCKIAYSSIIMIKTKT